LSNELPWVKIVLKDSLLDLQAKKRISKLRVWSDRKGVHAFLLESEGKKFILIGHGTSLKEGKLACHDDCYYYALENQIPLVIGLQLRGKGEREFYAFLPEWIEDGHVERDKKWATIVWFSFSLGEKWEMEEGIASITSRLHTRMEAARTKRAEMLKFKKEAESISSYLKKADEE